MASHSDPLSRTFRALADPTRRQILARLVEGTATVQELAAPFDMSLPAVSKHLRVLEEAELISRAQQAQWRHCSLRQEGFERAESFVSSYRAYWNRTLDRLEDFLAQADTVVDGGER